MVRVRPWHKPARSEHGAISEATSLLRKKIGSSMHSAAAREATDLIIDRLGADLSAEERKDIAYDLNDEIYKVVSSLFR